MEDQDQCEVITRNSKYPSAYLGFLQDKREKHETNFQSNQYQLSDVLLELEFVKHDLNEQINLFKFQESETLRFKKQFRDLEEEMQTTIASYQTVIE